MKMKGMIKMDEKKFEDEKIEEKELEEVSGGVKRQKDELDDLSLELKVIWSRMF